MTALAVPGARGRRVEFVIAAVLLVAVLTRWLAYTGFFGSDEVTYTESAFKLLRGDWTVDEYVGANRLGVNLPMAGFAWLLGKTEFAASLYSILCSLGEVALVTWVGYRMFGVRSALFAGLLMATLPAHVHVAGRLLADAPLCLTISAAFVLFYEADVRRWPLGFFLAGVCAGLGFWIKPATLFVFGVFLVYPLLVRRFNLHWLWMVVGLAVAMTANGLMFQELTGNFWFVIDVMRERRASGYLEAGAAAGEITSETHFYLTYLFVKVYHTGLVGYLALWGVAAAWLRRGILEPVSSFGATYTAFWGLGLLLILSVLPVGFSPLLFVPKQTNYMLIFMAPFCLLGGYALSRLPVPWSSLTAAVAVSVGVMFAMLLQGSVAVFTANSEATLRYAKARPSATFFVMSNAVRAARFSQLVGGEVLQGRVRPIKEWNSSPANGAALATSERYAIIDEETYAWDSSRPFVHWEDVPACWTAVEMFRGQPQGLGVALLRAVAAVPGLSGSGVGQRLRSLSTPKPAHVYRVPSGAC